VHARRSGESETAEGQLMPEAVRVEEEAPAGAALRGHGRRLEAEEAVVVASDVIVRLMLVTTKAEG